MDKRERDGTVMSYESCKLSLSLSLHVHVAFKNKLTFDLPVSCRLFSKGCLTDIILQPLIEFLQGLN